MIVSDILFDTHTISEVINVKLLLVFVLLFCSGCHWMEKGVPVSSMNDKRNRVNYEEIKKLSDQKIAWGLGPNKNEYGQPIDALNANDRYRAVDGYFVGKNANVIYLTFDNGYENGYTTPILDTLKETGTPALFFLTYDYVKDNQQLTQRMIHEGHEIGNHTYKHKNFPDISLKEITEEVLKLEEYMANEFHYAMRYVRPPKGEFTEQSLAVCQSLGYRTMLWSYAYYDYNVNDQYSYQTALEKLKKSLHPGAIYLLHCVSKTNSEVLKEFITYAKERGYGFELLDF